MLTIDQFKEVEMRVGLVIAASDAEGSDKLIRLIVDFGSETRVIFTGVRLYGYMAEWFVNKKWLFVTNLEYRKMMGEESQGMILAVDGVDGKPVFVQMGDDAPEGSRVR